MTTTQTPAPLRRTLPATLEYLPHIRPFGGGRTPLYDEITTGRTTVEAIHLDRILRSLLTNMPGRITAIIVFRDMLALSGIRLGLGEAKATIDAMIERMETEVRR